MDILETIVESKRRELEELRRSVPESLLMERLSAVSRPVLGFRGALADSPHGIIAEFKRKSPSKGWIHADIEPEDVVPKYARGGAAAVSILTDSTFFGGSLDFISRARPMVEIPILRKDFIIDPYQLAEARIAGADAVLLIAACLSPGDFRDLLSQAHRLGLEALLEVHSAEELDYVTEEVDVVGVNNRHLGSFRTDVAVSLAMAEEMDRRGIRNLRVSESGLDSPEIVKTLRDKGFRGFLMGERFMREPSPGAALEAFTSAL
ncbi:MAG: indole-3-glycerol phosphate synthase TrpC [Bacteroidales bacterium]|nr:indole-3-glycerol phosphate synthase TrpC [Bacteroidales bacterium]